MAMITIKLSKKKYYFCNIRVKCGSFRGNCSSFPHDVVIIVKVNYHAYIFVQTVPFSYTTSAK
jgi:hypothetical protein